MNELFGFGISTKLEAVPFRFEPTHDHFEFSGETMHEKNGIRPQNREFQNRDVWSVFNSFTSAMKDGNLAELPKRTEALHGLLDVTVGLN